MRTSIHFVLATSIGFCLIQASANEAGAQGFVSLNNAVRQRMVVPGYSPYLVQGGYFSPRLGAQFVIQTIQVGGFPAVKAARITSQPSPGSPLSQLGLSIGDVITRLDGIPVTRKAELENHVYETNVRFVKAGTSWVQQGWISVNPHQVFHNTNYPSNCQHSQSPIPYGASGMRP